MPEVDFSRAKRVVRPRKGKERLPLRAIREAVGKTQVQVTQAADMPQGDVSRLESFADGPAGGAMGVFTTRDAAEKFVQTDPFVSHGAVAHWTIREWNEALAP